MVSLAFLFLIAFPLTFSAPIQQYTGFRISLAENFIADIYNSTLERAVSSSASLISGNYTYAIGSGIMSFKFSITNFNCDGVYNRNYAKNRDLLMTPNSIVIRQNGTTSLISYLCTYQFEFQIFTIKLFSGVDTLRMDALAFNVSQIFSNRDFLATFVIPFNYTHDQSLIENDYVGINKALSDYVITTQIYLNLLNILSSNFNIQSKLVFKDWLDINNTVNSNIPYSILMQNSFSYVDQVVPHYLTMSFDTIETIDNKTYIQEHLYRKINTGIILGSSSCQICVSSSVLTHIIQVQGLDGDFVYQVDPTKVGPSGTVRDLFSIMPKLRQQIDPSLKLYITCKPDDILPILRINDTLDTNTSTRVQAPINCAFSSVTAVNLLKIKVFVRASIEKSVAILGATWKITGKVSNPRLFSLKVLYNLVDIEQTTDLYNYLGNIIMLLDGTSSPIGFTVKSGPVQFSKAEVVQSIDELCFNLS